MHQEIFEPLMLQGLFRFGVKLFNITLLQVWLYWKVSGNKAGGCIKSRTAVAKWRPPPRPPVYTSKLDQADCFQEGKGGMKWHVGHGGELSEKESDWRCLLIGVEQVICLRSGGRGGSLTGFINRLSHQQIKQYNKNCIVPWTTIVWARLPVFLGKWVPFNLKLV